MKSSTETRETRKRVSARGPVGALIKADTEGLSADCRVQSGRRPKEKRFLQPKKKDSKRGAASPSEHKEGSQLRKHTTINI